MPVISFKCPYCHRSYSREAWYNKHKSDCAKKKRFDQAHSMDFIRALRIYQHWRRRNGYLGKTKTIEPKDFINSSLYNSFINLVKFTSDNWVITSFKYIDFIIDRRIAEAKWTAEETLMAYREYTRRNDNPIEQIKETHQYIKNWCEKHNIDYIEFFNKIPTGQAVELITTNRISPWVLFGCDKGLQLLSRFDDDRLCLIDEFLNSKYWINRIRQSTDTAEIIQNECRDRFDV